MVRRVYVCRNCKRFTTGKACQFCKSTHLSTSWKGLVVIFNTESEIAKFLNFTEKGQYALYVG